MISTSLRTKLKSSPNPIKSYRIYTLVCLFDLPPTLSTHWLQPAWDPYCSSAEPAMLVLLFILYSLCLGFAFPVFTWLTPSQSPHLQSNVTFSGRHFMAILYCNLPIQTSNPHSLLLQCSLDQLRMYIYKFIFVYYLFPSLKCKIIDFTFFALFSAVS